MAIDRMDDTVDTEALIVDAGAGDQLPGQPRSARFSLAVASTRTVLLVVLALTGILVVLPAAIAAQAATGL